jgi:hypothetical protein
VSEKPTKISIGFRGGQTLVARVRPEGLSALRAALTEGGGWHELQTEDGLVVLSLERVDYLLVDAEDHRVGF